MRGEKGLGAAGAAEGARAALGFAGVVLLPFDPGEVKVVGDHAVIAGAEKSKRAEATVADVEIEQGRGGERVQLPDRVGRFDLPQQPEPGLGHGSLRNLLIVPDPVRTLRVKAARHPIPAAALGNRRRRQEGRQKGSGGQSDSTQNQSCIHHFQARFTII